MLIATEVSLTSAQSRNDSTLRAPPDRLGTGSTDPAPTLESTLQMPSPGRERMARGAFAFKQDMDGNAQTFLTM